MASVVESLFGRFGIQSPEEIRKQREKELAQQMAQGDQMSRYSTQSERDFGNIARLFGWQSPEEKKAAEAGTMLSAISAIPQENMAPEVESYYRSQLAAIDPELADAFTRDQNAIRESMLKAAKAGFGTTRVTVPEYGYDSKTKESYIKGQRSIEVPAKFDPEKGWVPIDPKYQGMGTGGDNSAIRGDLASAVAAKLGIKGTEESKAADGTATVLPSNTNTVGMEQVSSGYGVDMPNLTVGDMTMGGSGSGYGANEVAGTISYGGRNWTREEFMQRFPAVAAVMQAEGKL